MHFSALANKLLVILSHHNITTSLYISKSAVFVILNAIVQPVWRKENWRVYYLWSPLGLWWRFYRWWYLWGFEASNPKLSCSFSNESFFHVLMVRTTFVASNSLINPIIDTIRMLEVTTAITEIIFRSASKPFKYNRYPTSKSLIELILPLDPS